MRRSLTAFALFLSVATHTWSAVSVILIRHAEVSQDATDPSLSAQGQARAKLLADMLRDTQLDTIFVSDVKRTQQTARFVAEGHHITWQKKTKAADLASAIQQRTSGAVLIVGHSNTVPQAISLLGGPSYQIGDSEFDNMFILTVSPGQTSAVRLRYGNKSPGHSMASGASERKSIVQISFVKSGGFAGPMTRVQGTVNLKDNQPEITGDASYHRELAPHEADMLRAGAEPTALSEAAAQIASTQAKGKGMGDVEHYTIRVTTSDGKTHDLTLNASGGSGEMEGVAPATAKFLSWLQQEAQRILTQKMKPK